MPLIPMKIHSFYVKIVFETFDHENQNLHHHFIKLEQNCNNYLQKVT